MIWDANFYIRYEYGNIGKQVYDALKDGAYHQFKAYVAKKAVIATGDVDKIRWILRYSLELIKKASV